jgi:hypothetical protein
MQQPEDPPIHALAKPVQKPRRTSLASPVVADTSGQEVTSGVNDSKTNPIDYWRYKGRWPREYFRQDDQAREDFRKDFEKDSWYEKYWVPEMNMNHLLAKNKSSSSLRGASSAAPSSITPSDQKPREVKSKPYQDARYEALLATTGSFMGKSELGITDASKSFCRTLLETEQTVPDDSLFRDDLFEETCEMVRNKNEARVVRDISPLIAPSAEILAIRSAKHPKILIESVNEGWNNSMPITKTRPQPDYSIGFKRTAFTEDQLKKLQPFASFMLENSYFMATYYMYFPFFSCEVKCGAAALDIADRQNAHCMTLAVRGVVNLFRLVKREKELHREILAFSISHDDSSVRIYGHYPVIDGPNTTFYRHPIHKFDFTALDGKEKWTAYKFTKNVYDRWMPGHFKRICSAIDEIPPDLDFEVSELLFSVGSGLPAVSEDQNFLQQSNPDTTSLAGNDDSQSNLAGSITPNTSLSHGQPGAFKRPKRK